MKWNSERNLVFVDPEEVVGLEELFGWTLGVFARHHVHHDPSSARAGLKLCQFLESANPLNLNELGIVNP